MAAVDLIPVIAPELVDNPQLTGAIVMAEDQVAADHCRREQAVAYLAAHILTTAGRGGTGGSVGDRRNPVAIIRIAGSCGRNAGVDRLRSGTAAPQSDLLRLQCEDRMARKGVTERDLGWGDILREMRRLEHTTVTVGLQSDSGSDDEGVRNVDKAYWNEYGTRQIPERSFIRAGFDENRQDIDRTVDRIWNGVKLGRLTADRGAHILGQRHEDQVKQKARNGPFAPNSPTTVDMKGSSKPLIDSGQMVNSIRYDVEN